MMQKNLLLITGAGASYDSIDVRAASIAGQIQYRPLLTEELFTPSYTKSTDPYQNHFNVTCLKNNRKAYQVGYGIMLTKSINPEEGIEAKLYQLKNSKNLTDQKLYWTIPLYLNELFTEISRKYLPGRTAPSNYYHLLLELNRSKYKKIIWINLNYDLLADYAIEEFMGARLDGLDKYNGTFELSKEEIKSASIPLNFESYFGEVCYNPQVSPYIIDTQFYPAITAPDLPPFIVPLEIRVVSDY